MKLLWRIGYTLLSVKLLFGGQASRPREPVDYVDPNIGGIGHLLTATIPYVQYPHGMARLAPVTTPGVEDRYLADRIFGFPAGPALLMASTRPVTTDPAGYASGYDHDFEVATPYYYQVRLDDSSIRVEFTATTQAAYYRFTTPAGSPARLVLSMSSNAQLEVLGPSEVAGSQVHQGSPFYFHAEFSRPLRSYRTWKGGELSRIPKQSGDHIGLVAEIEGQLEVRVGCSYISTGQARANLHREIPRWSFDDVKERTRAVWNEVLGRIAVTGGTERQRTIFYTALYRTLGRPTDITEDGRYYSGFDHRVHSAEGRHFYVDDGLWDTYRSAHPLQLLIDPFAPGGYGVVLPPHVRTMRLAAFIPLRGRRARGDDRQARDCFHHRHVSEGLRQFRC